VNIPFRSIAASVTIPWLITAWGQPSDKQKTVDAGFDCHVVKSADPAYLDGLLEKLELKMTDA